MNANFYVFDLGNVLWCCKYVAVVY